MMRMGFASRCLAAAIVAASLLLSSPLPANGDGGIVLTDPQLWAQIKEAQQIAVVTLGKDNTAHVDLFVSLLDDSRQSHEVVFFVPLGSNPADFNVVETTSLTFDDWVTKKLDEELHKETTRKRDVGQTLFLGTLPINGAWMLPLWLPVMLSGCAAPTPKATYETNSSQVEIYGLDEDTDLEALISTTGLDPAVQQTLSKLKGQQIAVVNLRTQPPSTQTGSFYHPSGQPGVYLSWTTTLVSHSVETTYSYPLGTGSAWARPIELTRVYVVAPAGIDFTVGYPKLGADRSGFTPGSWFVQSRPKIQAHYHAAAYAVDEARGKLGHVWRVTYTQSNSPDDIFITVSASSARWSVVRWALRGLGGFYTFLISLFMALLLWVVAWRYTMPRVLGTRYSWRSSRLWNDALTYPGLNALIMLVAIVPLALVLMFAYVILPTVGTAVLVLSLVAVPALPNILRFLGEQVRRPGISRGRAAAAYVIVILASNVAYSAFAVSYAWLLGVL